MRYLVLLLGLLALGAGAAAAPALVYVSTCGNDTWSGKLPVPNAAGTDGPFASLARAREEVRRLRASGPVTVRLRGGLYRVSETLTLGPEDSGTAAAPVVWEATPGETVRLLGGARLSDFRPVSDPSVLERLDPAARRQVLQVDLKAAGVSDLARPTPVGGPGAQLICNNRYMPLARYPNEGQWLRIASIPQGGTPVKTERDSHYGRWAYDDERPARWRDVSDLWVHGYWVYDWADQYQRVEKLDLRNKEVSPQPPFHHYGYRKGQRFYFLNVLEELDSPGEWFLDRKAGLLYFWPPCAPGRAEVIFPELQKPMLTLQDAQYLQVRGLTFEGSRDVAAQIRGGSHCELAGCVVRNFGAQTAVEVTGTENGLRSCDVYEVAGTGVALGGGDRNDLTPGNNYVTNCDISRCGQTYRTYHGAIALSGVHNRIAHCYIHELPHQGIGYSGNDHIVEYCDFSRIAEETGDVGVLYSGADWTFMGYEVRNNYFHNVHGPGDLGCFTIYPDLPCGGMNLHHNVFYDVDQVFHTNSGRGMVIENNLFLRCRGMSFSTWTDAQKFKLGGDWHMVENLQAVKYDRPPYSLRYPVLQRLAADFALGDDQILQREIPKDNLVRRNLSCGNGFFLSLHPTASLQDVRCEDNVIANDVVFTGSFDGSGKARSYNNGDAEVAAELGKRGNIIVKPEAGAALWTVENCHRDPAARKIGFEPLPFTQVGLQRDEYRPVLPLLAYPPALLPAGGNFVGEVRAVALPTPQPGRVAVTIRYTVDGTEPNTKSLLYTQPLRLTKTTTLRCAAFVSDGTRTARSQSVAATYKALTLEQGAVYLSDLPEQDLTAYLTCWVKDTNHLKGPISLGGKEFPKGVLLHPNVGPDGKGLGSVTYDLSGPLARVRRFRATIGIDDSMERYKLGSATFAVEVLRNGAWQRVFESPVLKLGDKPQEVDVEVSGAEQLRLITTDAGDGISCDHAEWADARLL